MYLLGVGIIDFGVPRVVPERVVFEGVVPERVVFERVVFERVVLEVGVKPVELFALGDWDNNDREEVDRFLLL